MAWSQQELANMLRAAERALHRLQIGEQFVRVRLSDGSESEFTPPRLNELKAYVDTLRDQVAGIDRRRHGAINVIF
jgi:hypothetical protein